jgi:hypothetical protein
MAYQINNKTKIIGLLFSSLIIITWAYFLMPKKEWYKQQINPPVKNADLPFSEIIFNTDSALNIKKENGTLIHIPANAFTNLQGKAITGKVSLKYRTFDNAIDILRSGIPMSTNGDRNAFLQSAGMIELNAYQDGNQLMLKTEKYIDVELASFKKTDGFELYYLNDSANWNVSNNFNNIENSRKKLKLKNLIAPVSPNPKDSIQDLIFEMVANLNEVPYLKSFENLKWKIDRKNISEELLEAMRVDWDEVSIKEINKRKLKYEMVFTKTMRDFSSNAITKTFKVNASPVFNKEEKRTFRNDFAEKMKDYEINFAKYTAEKLRLEQEADMVNQFRINKMGIWNVDKVMNDADLLITNISFDFEKEIDPTTNHIMTYVIYEDNNSVITYLPKDLKKVGLLRNKKMKILAILPNNKIAIVNDDEIKAQLKISADRLFLKTVKANAEEYLKSPLSPPRGKFSKSS